MQRTLLSEYFLTRGRCDGPIPPVTRRFTIASLSLMAWLVGCGSANAPLSTTPPVAAIETPTATAEAGPSASAAAAVPCTPGASGSDALTGFGAGFAAWSSHHQVDPRRADFFLPALNDGVDRYTSVMCTTAGRVIAYHLNFTPSISVAAAKHAFRAELPADAVLVYDIVQSGCEHIQYRSASLARGLAEGDPGGVADAAIILPDDPREEAAVGTLFIDARVRLNETPVTC
jgi:hypothetical protein